MIVDIGGNDGTNLLQYQKLGFKELRNVESAENISLISSKNGIATDNCYFNEKYVDWYLSVKSNKAKLINASGVFFHLEELHSVISGIKKLLMNGGVFIVQFMYLGDMIKNLAFDGIYHEHLCYYSLKSLKILLEPHELSIFDAYHSDIHGGSIIAKIEHSDSNIRFKLTERYEKLINEENITLETLQLFAKEVENRKHNLKNFLMDLKNSDMNIIACGAPAKSTTFLNYFNIKNDVIEYILEVNDLKIGLYTPGTYIPIIREEKKLLFNKNILLLSWNFLREILNKNKDVILNSNSRFIIPFPEIHIINKNNINEYL